MMMKKTILISCLLLLCAMPLRAQRIQVVDGDGTPIPYVTVTTTQGKFIASTDIDGWLESVGENTTIHLSQVAYKPLTIAVADIKDGRITLDEAGYDLPEVVVKPKELLYCQAYFRDVYIDDDGPIFYRAGVIDNAYDIDKKEVSAKSRQLSKAQSGFWRALYNSTSGQYDKFARLPEKSYYDKIRGLQQKGTITLTDTGNGRQIIADSICQLGYIYWNAEEHTRTVSFNLSTYHNHIENKEKQDEFARRVDSADVFINASTRFADGFRFGKGAEVGISTNKIHARGPMGMEGLMIYKYVLVGNGHMVKDYAGKNAKPYTHRKIDLRED